MLILSNREDCKGVIIIATIAELLVKISGDSSGLRKELAASQRQIKNAYGSMGMNMAGKVLTGVEAIAVGFGAASVAAITFAGTMEQMQVGFSTLLGGAAAGAKMTETLVALADSTPFTTSELGKAAKQMLAYGFAAKDVPGLLVNVGDAASALGMGAEGVQRITMALGQMGAKGTVQSDEMRQLAEAGIPAWKMLADTMGVSIPDAMAAVEKRAVSSATGINSILEGMHGKFAGAMDDQSKTLLGAFSNAKDGAENLMAGLGGKLADSIGLTSIFSGAGQWMAAFAASMKPVTDEFGNVTRAGLSFGEAFKTMVPDEVILGMSVLGGIIAAIVVPSLISMAVAAAAAIVPFLPLIAVGAALGVLAFEVYNNWDLVKEPFENLGEIGGKVFADLVNDAEYAWGWIANNAQYVSDVVVEVWNTIGDSASQVWTGIMEVADAIWSELGEQATWFGDLCSNVWAAIAGFFQEHFTGIYTFCSSIFADLSDVVGKFADWVSDKLSVVLGFASKVYNVVAETIGFAAGADWGNVKLGITTDFSDVTGNVKKFLPSVPSAAVTKPDLSGFGSDGGATKTAKGGKGRKGKSDAEKEADKEAKAFEKLGKDANKVNESILKDWRAMYQTKEDIATADYMKQLDKLNESKAANTQYDEALQQLNETRFIKLRVAAATQASLEKGYRDDAIKEAEKLLDLQNSSLRGSRAIIAGFDESLRDDIKSINDDLAGIVTKINQTENVKDRQLLITEYTKEGILSGDTSGTITDANTAEFANKRINQRKYNEDQKREDGKYNTFKADLDLAYNKGNLENYAALLDDRRNLDNKDLTGKQAYMDQLKTMWSNTHHTIYDDAATLMSGVYTGLESTLESFAKRTASVSDVFKSFLDSVLDGIIKIQAQAVASQIASSIFGGAGTESGSKNWLTKILGFADGGLISGIGTGTSDSIIAKLSHGEYVMPADATARIGVANLDAMRGYATGGLIGSNYSSTGNYGAGSSKPNIVINNNSSAKVTATEGTDSQGMYQVIFDIATEAVLSKSNSSPAYANNLKGALGAW